MNSNQVLTIPGELAPPQTAKKTKFIVGGLAIALAIVYLIYTGIQSTSAYYVTVDEFYVQSSELAGKRIRISGMVDPTTIDYNNKDLILKFEIMGENGQQLPIVFNGPKPDQMREGAEAIVEGEFDGSTFEAKTLLLKCPSRYEEGIEEIQVESVR